MKIADIVVSGFRSRNPDCHESYRQGEPIVKLLTSSLHSHFDRTTIAQAMRLIIIVEKALRRFDFVLEMTILLGADMSARIHRRATHGAAWSSRGNDRLSFRAQVAGLLSRNAACKCRVRVFFTIDVVSDDDEAIDFIVVSQFHAPHTELAPGLAVEFSEAWRALCRGTRIRQPFQHLLQRQAKRMHLLLFHPDCMCFAVDDRKQSESSFPGLANRFDLNSLRVEVTRHQFQSTSSRR